MARPAPRVLATFLAALAAACGASSTPATDGPVCPAPGCPAGTLAGVTRGTDGVLSGAWTRPGGGATLPFTVAVSGAGAVATFGTVGGGPALTATLAGADTGTLSFDGAALDGVGAPDAAEAAALDALAGDADLRAALASVPLELACGGQALADAEMAALALPWQVLLKYRTPGRVAAVQALALGSSCGYFADLRAADAAGDPPPDGLLLSHEHPLPGVLGWYPFDDAGAVDGTDGVATGAAGIADSGPCGALCRGSCGADCDHRNCKQTGEGLCLEVDGRKTGEFQVTYSEDCGIAQGCIEHDDCYDDCNVRYACGANWGHQGCMRGCDASAAWKFGSDTASWARGGGPFESRHTFTWQKVKEDPATCPPDAATPTDKPTGRLWLGATPFESKDTLAWGLHVLDPDSGDVDFVHDGPVDGVAVSPSGTRLAAGILQQNDIPAVMAVFDVADPKKTKPLHSFAELAQWPGERQQLTGPAFVTDDLMVVSKVGDLFLYDLVKKASSCKIWPGWHSSAYAGTNSIIVEGTGGLVGLQDVNRGGYANYDAWDIAGNFQAILSEDPLRIFRVQGSSGDWTAPKVSPDGQRIAFLDAQRTSAVRVVKVGTSATISDDQAYEGPGGKVKAVAWSPDGKWLAFVVAGAKDGGGGIWVVEAGNPLSVKARQIRKADFASLWHVDLAWGP